MDRVSRSQRWSVLVAVPVVLTAMLAGPAPALAESEAAVPSGFRDRLVWSGMAYPTAVTFAPSGSVYVALKDGRVLGFDGLADASPTLVADLRTETMNESDRGLLGLAADPDQSRPYLYALYTYDREITGGTVPRWGEGWDYDGCPHPPGATTDGCMVSGRLERLTLQDNAVVARKVLVTDWCQQFPSHSIGTVAIGPEGALYASGGDGASYDGVDFGQLGGSLPDTPTPVNPCNDPVDQGGALRSQDVRTTSDPTGLDGTIIRIDPDTGAAWPGNANIGAADTDARKIIAYGLRNPFRFAFGPDDRLWAGEVGWGTHEEINVIADPDASPRNFGWPCFEGPARQVAYDALGLSMCSSLTSQSTPAYSYPHSASVVSGDGCGTGGSSVSGIVLRAGGGAYPTAYARGLYFTDYSRRCIWFAREVNGSPDFGSIVRFANLRRSTETDGASVYVGLTPEGNVIYADIERGEVRQIVYESNDPPVAAFTMSPTSGLAPLFVSFDAVDSTDVNGGPLQFAWDMDGDGAYDDATGIRPTRTFNDPGLISIGLRVTDEDGNSDTVRHTLDVDNRRPTATVDAPEDGELWTAGQTIQFSGTGTDAQDGTLAASAFHWRIIQEHCPSDCHAHVIRTVDDVKSGSFVAPDHEYPSFIRLELTVTDSDGASTTVGRDAHPETGTVDVVSDPPGIALTLGPATGAPPPTLTGIVDGAVDVTAPSSVTLGETTYAFASWSDGGARHHRATVVSGSRRLTASFTQTDTGEAPDTCTGTPLVPSSTWHPGRLDRAGDVDWYRFTNSSTKSVEVILGDLPVDASLRLYKGCSTLLTATDAPGTATETIIKHLGAGTYAVRIATRGDISDSPYVLRIKRMPTGLSVRSAATRIDAGRLSLVGEVWNESSSTRGPIKVKATLRRADGTVIGTRTRETMMYAVSHSRVPFRIDGTLPAGFARATFTLSAPTSTGDIRGVTVTGTTTTIEDGRWRVRGTIKAESGGVKDLAVGVALYGRRGAVVNVVAGKLGRTTLASAATTTFDAWADHADPTIERARWRALGLRR